MLIFKLLVLILFFNCIYSSDIILKNIRNVRDSMSSFDKYGCSPVFSKSLNETNSLKKIIKQYLLDSSKCSVNEYNFIVGNLKPKIESLSNELEYLLHRCNARDYSSDSLSLERPARLHQFLQEWNSTLESLGQEIETRDFYTFNLDSIKQSANIVHHKDSQFENDFYHFKDCQDSYCPEMVVIPQGSFIMGGSDEEHAALSISNEIKKWDLPRHQVTFKKKFAIGQFEITSKQFREFVKETGYKIPKGCIAIKNIVDPSTGNRVSRLSFNDELDYENLGEGFEDRDESHPAVCLRREDVRNFAQWLSIKTGQTYRLPYEAEWEYVTRADQKYQYYIWGNTTEGGCKYANLYDLDSFNRFKLVFKNFNCTDGFVATAPVGSYLPNQFGIYDLLANAREWVDDCWHYSFDGAPSDGSRWGEENNGLCDFGVLRGGSFFYNTFNVRIAYRNAYFSSQSKSYMWGGRLVREIN
ncbi:hypothetical protein DICPUDRAFT_96521 [Dictyostelium purpureum]|uniref:Sulfatase-modifying factor enzyme-like domain-containing protein n=1 Tax=Dictyostelium purpureum TaxID=5786 RepID=F0Z907_DICPU|nr:uncharacterized protein DICPUDRAFT_96521 [Dictyostelium purpureum]EGC39575.1 hypothetical protein DICPUDRAFT_96521 [Dictyostelium purpureum]|eukprot:XP_003283910.1 hypothetical protein DICPUDRAFT_96521 [Dictyostelium purpureum]